MSTLRSAKTLGMLSGWTISNLPAQKMLYLSHLTHLGEGHDGSIVSVPSEFEAWDYGPVSPILYYKVKAYGDKPYPDIFGVRPFVDGDPEFRSIEYVFNQLKDSSPGQLINITHWREGAWAKSYRPGVRGVRIPDGDVLDEYRAWERRTAA